MTNLASYNYYNLAASEPLKEKAIQTLRHYGVGPCGPPGFYGTQDVHLRTEADVAAHLGLPACIVYAQAFSTISSVIPAFSKRGDIVVADARCNYSIRKGVQISRSTVRWYKHNDLEDLERVLAGVVREQAGKPLTRRFIVTEGLFEDVGDAPDLPRIVALKLRYKFRLILDETWSYGVLGRTGRGLTEQQHVDAADVDMLIGSLAGPLCAGGGFCAGSEEVVEHQRISALAYTFSAALPAMLAATASETINLVQTCPEMLAQAREHTRLMWAQLDPRSEWVCCTSAVENPMMVLVLKAEVVARGKWTVAEQEQLLQDAVDEVGDPPDLCALLIRVGQSLANGVLIARRKEMPREATKGKNQEPEVQPALRVCITTGLTKREIERAGITIRHAITKVVKKRISRLSESS